MMVRPRLMLLARLVWKGPHPSPAAVIELLRRCGVRRHEVPSVKAWSAVPKAIFFIVRQHGHTLCLFRLVWFISEEERIIRWKLWG